MRHVRFIRIFRPPGLGVATVAAVYPFPSQAISLVLPHPAGGHADVVAHVVTPPIRRHSANQGNQRHGRLCVRCLVGVQGSSNVPGSVRQQI